MRILNEEELEAERWSNHHGLGLFVAVCIIYYLFLA
jgi:hypothetical protein